MKIKKWHIYRADLDPVTGSEQRKTRPVVIISENEINDLLNIVNVLPVITLDETGAEKLTLKLTHCIDSL